LQIYADTHVVACLFAGRFDLIPSRAQRLIEDNPLVISPRDADVRAYDDRPLWGR
jgi:hypothetical protein